MPLDELELTSLTNLNWNQKLVASVRLMLACGMFDYGIPAELDGSPLDDTALQTLAKQPFTAFAGPPLVIRHSDGIAEMTLGDFSGAQIRFVRELQSKFADPSRANAIVAVLFAELGWPVVKIGRILQTSRPTLNRWVMTHANTPVNELELDMIAETLTYVQIFLDLRNAQARAKHSTALWKKAVFLPPEDLVPILSALWRVSYRVRGERSRRDELMCSYALDMFIDLLLRRGATGLNLGRIVNVSHAAVLLREGRSIHEMGHDTWDTMEPDGFNGVFRHLKDGVHNGARSTIADEILNQFTKMHIRGEQAGNSLVLQVRTGRPTDKNPLPSPNISVLCVPTSPSVSVITELDESPLYAVSRDLDRLTGEYYMPLLMSGTTTKRNHIVKEEILRWDDGYPEPEIRELETHDLDAAAQLFDAQRHHYHGIVSPNHWKNCTLMTEGLLCQATATYNRDLASLGRAGFGETSYHQIPAEASDLIWIVPSSRADDAIERLRRSAVSAAPPETHGLTREDFTDKFLARFMSEGHNEILRKMLDSVKGEGTVEDTLLFRCLYYPETVIDEFPAPRKRGRTVRED